MQNRCWLAGMGWLKILFSSKVIEPHCKAQACFRTELVHLDNNSRGWNREDQTQTDDTMPTKPTACMRSSRIPTGSTTRILGTKCSSTVFKNKKEIEFAYLVSKHH